MLEYVLGLATIATLTINSCGLECGKVTRLSRDGRVIGGNAVSPDVVYPWMVAFVLADTLTGSRPPVVRCAGSLITRRHILTAAHCYGRNGTEEDMIGKFLLVYMLRDKCQDHGEFLVEPQADRVIVHPGFRERTFVNDIAIVVLETEVPYTPICLPTSVAEKRDAMILGYGSVFPHTIYPCLLQQAIVNIYGKNKCGVPSAAAVICAGRLEGGIDTCDGDSGGPLQNRNYEGYFVLRGITSFGFGCGKKGYPGIYTDVYRYRHWIYDEIGRERYPVIVRSPTFVQILRRKKMLLLRWFNFLFPYLSYVW